jgi:hypothetical protein
MQSYLNQRITYTSRNISILTMVNPKDRDEYKLVSLGRQIAVTIYFFMMLQDRKVWSKYDAR